MEPDKTNLKLLPKPVVNSAARLARVNAVLAAILMLIGFLVLWGPFYLLRTDTQLVLYPFVFVCIPVIWVFAIRAVIYGRRGLQRAASASSLGRRTSRWSLLVGIATIILPVPLFLFGGLPLQLAGAG